MTTSSQEPDLSGKRRSVKRRVKGNKFVTKSGKTIKLNRTMSEKSKARQDAKALRKAERLKGMPKGRFSRFVFRMHPKRLYKYWFSRDGLYMALKITGIGFAVGFLFLAGLFAYIRKDLPNLRDISGNNIGGSIRYYDRTGETLLWEDYDAVKRVPVASENIADYLKKATIAIEDRDFYEHNGFNVRGISRAAWNNAFGGPTQGGSTITQQLVKLTTEGFSTDRTISRKLKELILSVEFERSYSKEEILAGYLNSAPYGPIEYGAEVAARTYFDKSAKDLTLDEASLLAAVPKAPPTYSPYGPYFDREELIGRQHYILDVMVEEGYITAEERDAAKQVDTLATIKQRQPKYTGIIAPHFVLAAKSQVESDLTEASYLRGGWKVITTVDLKLQKIAEEEAASGIRQIERQRGNTLAFVAEDVETGQVVALVGGADFNNKDRAGEFNFAQRPLPPGSSFKPYDYLALVEHTENSGAGSVIYDTQGPLEGYPCTDRTMGRNRGNCLQNYDFRYPGPVTLRYALGGSRNVPAVKSMLIVGVDKTIETANKLGLYDSERQTGGYKCYADFQEKIETQCYGASAIGDGAYLHLDKHVHSYATISRNGNKVPQTYILKVEDSRGKKLYEWQPSAGEQVVRPDSAYIIADIMADPRASYMSRKSHDYKGWDFSLKTGTTNDNKDGWLMGFSTKYAAGIWVGHHTGQVEMTGFMETMTQPIWQGFMQRAHSDISPIPRPKPSGVQTLPAFIVRNHVGVSSIEPSPERDLFPSWYKRSGATNKDEKIRKDKVSGKLATECTPALAIEEVTEGAASQFSSDPFYNSTTNTQEKDDVHKCDDVKPSVSIDSINNGNGSYTFNVTVAGGTHPISSDKFLGKLTVSIDGNVIADGARDIGAPGTYPFSYSSTLTTTATVTAYVTDSVLYEAQDAIDVPFTVPAAAPVPPPVVPLPPTTYTPNLPVVATARRYPANSI
jgi:membrane peptidoglycan carboxypeptidase